MLRERFKGGAVACTIIELRESPIGPFASRALASMRVRGTPNLRMVQRNFTHDEGILQTKRMFTCKGMCLRQASMIHTSLWNGRAPFTGQYVRAHTALPRPAAPQLTFALVNLVLRASILARRLAYLSTCGPTFEGVLHIFWRLWQPFFQCACLRFTLCSLIGKESAK